VTYDIFDNKFLSRRILVKLYEACQATTACFVFQLIFFMLSVRKIKQMLVFGKIGERVYTKRV